MKNTGRRNNIPREFRFCPFCKNILEDELHFMFICPQYNDLRTRYMLDIDCKECNSLISLLQNENSNYLYMYAKYIKEAFMRRSALLL